MSMDADGDYVITWASQYQDGFSWRVYAQRFNASGVPQGPEFRVNTTTTNTQWNPSVAMDANGDFIVAWESANIGSYAVYDSAVYAQRYNAAGVPQGSEFRVSTSTSINHFTPSVAADADGDFVIVWRSYLDQTIGDGIYAQRYNAAGVVQGSQFRVNTTTTGVLDGFAGLDEQLQPLLGAVVVTVAEVGDGLAGDVFHHEVRPAGVGGAGVVDGGDVGVTQQRQGLAFRLEAGDHLPRVHTQLDELDGDDAADGMALLGLVDQTHAPFADLLDEVIVADVWQRFVVLAIGRFNRRIEILGGGGQSGVIVIIGQCSYEETRRTQPIWQICFQCRSTARTVSAFA
jgi:hypothetical protein